MRKPSLVLGLVMLMSSVSHAEIHEDLVVMLGVRLTPAQVKAARDQPSDVASSGLELVDNPTMTWGKPVATATFAGKVIAKTRLDRTTSATPTALPTATDLEAVRKSLSARGWPTDVQIIAIAVYTGGK
jgi:hypothetical protein